MKSFLGVDVGGTNTKIGVVEPSGKIRDSTSFPTGDGGPRVLAKRIADWTRGRDVRAAGVGVPSPLDVARTTIVWAVNLGWKNVPFARMLSKALRRPVVMENDANVAMWAEYKCGTARGCRSAALYTLGTGIGGGIVIEGRLVLGDGGFAAELGHVIVDPDGPRCGCGMRGCLEAFASATAFRRRFRELTGRASPEPRDIFQRARKGDRTCLKIVDEGARALGIATASIANTINPSVVVLSGGMSLAGKFYLDKIRQETRRRMYVGGLDIVLGKLQENAGLIGAALWGKERCGT